MDRNFSQSGEAGETGVSFSASSSDDRVYMHLPFVQPARHLCVNSVNVNMLGLCSGFYSLM